MLPSLPQGETLAQCESYSCKGLTTAVEKLPPFNKQSATACPAASTCCGAAHSIWKHRLVSQVLSCRLLPSHTGPFPLQSMNQSKPPNCGHACTEGTCALCCGLQSVEDFTPPIAKSVDLHDGVEPIATAAVVVTRATAAAGPIMPSTNSCSKQSCTAWLYVCRPSDAIGETNEKPKCARRVMLRAAGPAGRSL